MLRVHLKFSALVVASWLLMPEGPWWRELPSGAFMLWAGVYAWEHRDAFDWRG